MDNRTRIVLLGVFAVLVAVWGSSASLVPARSDEQADPRARDAEKQAAPALFDLDAVSDRLRARQREAPPPESGGRNPFEFGRRATAASVIFVTPAPPAADAIAPPPPSEPPPPLFTLSGIADKAGDQGAVRTAVISGLGQLFFAKVGDNVTARYTVAAIRDDAVELRDVTTGETLRLALQ